MLWSFSGGCIVHKPGRVTAGMLCLMLGSSLGMWKVLDDLNFERVQGLRAGDGLGPEGACAVSGGVVVLTMSRPSVAEAKHARVVSHAHWRSQGRDMRLTFILKPLTINW